MAGYSGKPLAAKLGIRSGCRLLVRNTPENYRDLIGPLANEITVSSRLRRNADICHFFTRSAAELRETLPILLQRIRRDGMLWVSWPKKASRVATDVTEDTIRDAALPLGLVDVKVCAVDETWSGLKLVIRRELRRQPARLL